MSFALPAETRIPSIDNIDFNFTKLNPFLKIGEDNSIQIILSKVEMGQGIWTTLPMLVAEELDCDWNKIKVEHVPSGSGDQFKQHLFEISTGGSDTTRSEFERYRLAGATARLMLIHAAAKRFGVLPEDCKTEKGYIISGDQRISYGKVATEASKLPIPDVKLESKKEWKLIGKSQKRLDIADKVNGKAIYGIDIHFEGLLTALVVHAPVFGGKIISYDANESLRVNGVRQVVQIPSGIAVIADHFWAAKKGKELLQIQWDTSQNENINTVSLLKEYSQLSKSQGVTTQEKGKVDDALEKSDHKIDVEFSFPYLAHAPLETINCVVKLDFEKCEIWAGTQSPWVHQSEVASFLGVPPEQVKFNTPTIGGSFGRKGSLGSDWVMEAVHIAKASNKPIKLIWTREDDIKGGNYRPMYVHRVSIAIGSNGFPIAWNHKIVGQSLFTNTLLEKFIAPNGFDYSSIDGVQGSPYLESVPDHRLELITTQNDIPVLAWRSVGNTHTAFVMEVLINELAKMAGQDPVEYRRILLKNSPRHLASLNLAVEQAEWSKPLPPGQFRGIAVHKAMGSYVTQIVELSVTNQIIKLHRVVCAIDCGLAVNPDGVKAQMESGIVFGITAALYGEITLEQGRVIQSNFHDYQMLRMNNTPKIEVYIVPSTETMGGAGEPGVPPIAPAIANALFEATGKSFRSLPLKL
ncbi:MAG: xanthine dehydrogenase family protein molybdopterin-binding subunit [Saprospiraceae bacterium]